MQACNGLQLLNQSTQSTDTNCSNASPTYPPDLRYTSDNTISIVAYSVLFVVSACGNLTVFITLFRNRHRKSRVNLFIMHLSVADLLVTFIMIPNEIAWHWTVAWMAGDAMCRLFMFFRTFGFYLSSFILIAISLDRYFAITRPMSLSDAGRRGKLMLLFAWLFSIVASTPQSIIFHVEKHPNYPQFEQCVTFNFFPSPSHELVYSLFNISAVYIAPLLVIIISYTLILIEITRKSRENMGTERFNRRQKPVTSVTETLRRSGVGRMEKARIKTLKMTVVIVTVFVLCWSPYYGIMMYHWVDGTSAQEINTTLQRFLFIFAVSNSCMNPIVYGLFTRTVWIELRRCCCLLPTWLAAKNKASITSTSPPPIVHNNNTSSTTVPRWHAYHRDIQMHYVNGKSSVALLNGVESSSVSATSSRPPSFDRRITPPHIAVGRGNKYQFENLLL